MEAMLSSSSSYLKSSFSYTDKTRGFLCIKNELFGSTYLKSSMHLNHKNKSYKDQYLNLSLSISPVSRIVHPHSISSSLEKVEFQNTEVKLEESHNKNTNESDSVRVRFMLQRRCSYGQRFLIVGDDRILGSWDPKKAIPMSWSDGHVWTVDMDITTGRCIKFKFIMQVHKRKFIWQPGPNRIFEVGKSNMTITLFEDWENVNSRKVIEVRPMLNQADESTITPEMDVVIEESKTMITDNTVESKVKISDNRKEKSTEPKGYVKILKRKSGSCDRVPVLVPSLSLLPATDVDQGDLVNQDPTMLSAGVNN